MTTHKTDNSDAPAKPHPPLPGGKTTRGALAGAQMGDGIVGFLHLMYQKDTARRVLDALVRRLRHARKEFER